MYTISKFNTCKTYKILTFPNDFNDDVLGNGPLNTSHIKQPSPHISDDLKKCIKLYNNQVSTYLLT